MARKGQALRPDFFISNMPHLVADKEAEKKGATEEERSLYSLSKSHGWKILAEYIDNILEDLDNYNGKAIEQGATFDVLGQNAVVINLTKSLIKRVLNKVDDAREACERPEGST